VSVRIMMTPTQVDEAWERIGAIWPFGQRDMLLDRTEVVKLFRGASPHAVRLSLDALALTHSAVPTADNLAFGLALMTDALERLEVSTHKSIDES
jgi:hypothetical protein